MFKKSNSENDISVLHTIFGKMQEEEFCRIVDLKKSLEYSDILTKHLSNYLSLGWGLTAINSLDQDSLEVDFHQPQNIWSEKVMELGLDGVVISLGVLTGSVSRLLVLEVHKQGKRIPFRRDDWSSRCVAEVGEDLEQHYYELPEGWQLPASLALEPYPAKVFGDGGLVLAPPSLEPRVQANWRWVCPPWEGALNQPPPVLRKIIKDAVAAAGSTLGQPISTWEEIYPAIASRPAVFQALMTPAPSPESYYQQILAVARAHGLKEPRLLLSLLWHAPLGKAREDPQGLAYLQQLVKQGNLAEPLGAAIQEDQDTGSPPPEEPGIPTTPEEPVPFPGPPHHSPPVVPEEGSRSSFRLTAFSPNWDNEGAHAKPRSQRGSHRGNGHYGDSWEDLFRASQEKLIVERQRYEAMIYELGKLEVWREICKQERREKKLLFQKLEGQWTRELDYLRDLLKKTP